MQLSLPAVVLLALVLVFLIRSGSLKVSAAIVATLFGFFLASTSLVPPIHNGLGGVTSTIGQIDP